MRCESIFFTNAWCCRSLLMPSAAATLGLALLGSGYELLKPDARANVAVTHGPIRDQNQA